MARHPETASNSEEIQQYCCRDEETRRRSSVSPGPQLKLEAWKRTSPREWLPERTPPQPGHRVKAGHTEEMSWPLSTLALQYPASVSHWPSARWRQRGRESWLCNLQASASQGTGRTQKGGEWSGAEGRGVTWQVENSLHSPQLRCSLLEGSHFWDRSIYLKKSSAALKINLPPS